MRCTYQQLSARADPLPAGLDATWSRAGTPHAHHYALTGPPTTVKAAKYADQDNFIPLFLETGGRVNQAARDWLVDALTAPEPGEQVPSQDDHPWDPQARTTTETALREAMHAAGVQARMLARIVVEIHPRCRHPRRRVGTVPW